MLTCPVCLDTLRPRVFTGYYDAFVCYTCACTDRGIIPPGATLMAGAYGGGPDGAPATPADLNAG